jgi:hypothetical protein
MNVHKVFAVLLLMGSWGIFAAGQGSDPGLAGAGKGTWKLNVEKSDYGQQPKPKSMRLVVSSDTPTSVKWVATGTDGSGKPINESFTGAIDGKQYPVKGDPQAKSVAYSNSGNDVKGVVTMRDGTTANETVSMPDKNTLTVKVEGGSGGTAWGTSEVWERVTSGARKASTKKSAS